MKKICIFSSGNGSNFKSIFQSTKNKSFSGIIALLISNNVKCGAVEFAKQTNIKFAIINNIRYPKKDGYTKINLHNLLKHKIELIVLAGFMKKIPIEIVKKI